MEEDDGDEWESVPDDETQPLGELDGDHPAPVTEPHSPNAFFVPSPDLNPDPSGESVGVYNAGAATTAEADEARVRRAVATGRHRRREKARRSKNVATTTPGA